MILSVDDIEEARYVRTRALTAAGFDVREAGTGGQALELAGRLNPSLILLDVRLPDIDGFDVCRRLKSNPQTSHIPVVHISAASTQEHDYPAALEHGADAYLHDPVEPSVLVATIKALIRARSAERHEHEAREEAERSGRLSILAQRAANAGAWEWDIATNRMTWSDEYYTLFQVDRRTIPNFDNWMGIVHEADRKRIRAELDDALRHKRDFAMEFRIMLPDGVHWVERRGGFVLDEAGNPVRALGISMDISDRKQLEERLRQSNDDLQRFAYAASHDLQEPLRTIGSFTRLLARHNQGKLDADSQEYIDFITSGVDRMNQIIQDLLDYSRVSGSQLGRNGEADLNRVVEAVLANLKNAIERNRAEVTWDPLPTVPADPTLLGRVMQNLIANALKYRSQQPPRVHIACADRSGCWLFSIADNGIGFEKKHAERIFGLFQRLHTTSEYPGTGIGLAIVKRIVERHGGQVCADSEPGKGATFYFTLPKSEPLTPSRETGTPAQSAE